MPKKLLILATTLMLALGSLAQGSLDKGINADSKGLYDLAAGYYREAVDTNAQARLRLGLLLQRQEHFAEASEWLAKADSSALAMTHLAECLGELRDWPAAKQAAEKAIELSDTSEHNLRASAMATLGLVYCVDENYTNALAWSHKAEKEDPSSARALNVTGIIQFYKGNDNDATQTFRKAIQIDSKNIDAYFNLGSMYCYRNHYDLAISTLNMGL